MKTLANLGLFNIITSSILLGGSLYGGHTVITCVLVPLVALNVVLMQGRIK